MRSKPRHAIVHNPGAHHSSPLAPARSAASRCRVRKTSRRTGPVYAERAASRTPSIIARIEIMRTRERAYPWKDLIVLTAEGTMHLEATKAALTNLAVDPAFDPGYEVLLDFREVQCQMSVTDVYELAQFMASIPTALPTRQKIAVLVTPQQFDHAKFLEVCATNRGVALAAFEDYDQADSWLKADLPPDPNASSSASA